MPHQSEKFVFLDKGCALTVKQKPDWKVCLCMADFSAAHCKFQPWFKPSNFCETTGNNVFDAKKCF